MCMIACAVAGLGPVPEHVARGASTTPVVGEWPFCTAADQVGCIDYFSFEDATGTMREYVNAAAVKYDGIDVSARCFRGGLQEGDPCAPQKTTVGCGTAGLFISLVVTPSAMDRNMQPQEAASYFGRKFIMRVRTGDFDPVFSLGKRIESTRRSKLDSGLFTFEVNGLIDRSYGLSTSDVSPTPPDTYRSRLSQFLKTSKASSVSYGGGVSIYPSDFLKSTSIELGGLCVDMPFVGAYADANGMGFTTSWVPAKPTDSVASTIKFEVSGPHYLPESNGADDKIVPARIRFFLPDQFFTAAGYKDPSTFDASRLLITTMDGEKPAPTLTRKTGGVLVDFGITHYSAPDPVVTIYREGMSASTTTTSTTTTVAAPATATTVPSLVASSLSLGRGKSLTSSKLVSASGLSRPVGSTVSIKVSASTARYCRVLGTSVRALKAGTCRVTVTVRPKNGTSKSKTVSVKIT